MANNYDQIRAMSLLGLSPQDPFVRFGQQSMNRPIRFFVKDRPSERIYYSSETEMLRVATWLTQTLSDAPPGTARFDVKLKGMLEAGAVCVLALLFLVAFYRLAPVFALIFALAFALWSDPVNALYANTLYPEFFSASTAFFALTAFSHAVLSDEESSCSFFIGCAFLALFALSKPQYSLAPIIVLVSALIVGKFRKPRNLVALVTVAVASAAALGWADRQPWMDSLRMAGRVNVVFETVLPALDDPTNGVRQLGLPDPCARFTGKNWYSDDERVQPDIVHVCPQIASVKTGQIARVVLSHPESWWKLLGAGLDNSHPYYEGLIGHVEGGDHRKISTLEGLRFRSIAEVFDQARGPSTLFNAYILVVAGAGILAFAVAFRRRDSAALFLLTLHSGLLGYYFLTSLIGDGVFDMARHNFLHQTFVPCAALLFVAVIASSGASTASIRRGEA